jgi:hypothetical protein
MNKLLQFIAILSIVLAHSCTSWTCQNCENAMRSSDPNDIVDAYFHYKEKPSDVCKPCVEAIFYNIMDGRVNGSIKGYGSTPFVLKIALLEKISGIKSEVVIHTSPDSAYLKPYIDWYHKTYK